MTQPDGPPQPAGVLQLEIEWTLRAPRERVWEALVGEVAASWPADFYCLGRPARMILEPHVGGRLYEDAGGAALLWATVVLFDPPSTIAFAGNLLPPWGGPATTLWRLTLESAGGPATLLRLNDHVYGRVDEQLRTNLDLGWRQLFERGLKEYVEQ